jgi:hypothetical protein
MGGTVEVKSEKDVGSCFIVCLPIVAVARTHAVGEASTAPPWGPAVADVDFIGAPGRYRTCNPCLRRAVLYPLSYGRSGADSIAALRHRSLAAPGVQGRGSII